MWSKCLATFCFCTALLVAACTNRAAVIAPKTPASPPPALIALEEGDRAFTARQYDDASRAYEDYLRLTPTQDQSDQALFRLGLAYTLRKTDPSWERAITLWKRVISDYPDSPAKPQAEIIIALYSEIGQVNTDIKTRDADIKARDDRIKQLSTELDRLKRIDADRRKTP